MRVYKGRNNDRIRWRNGRSNNIRNNGGKCLMTVSNVNRDRYHLTFGHCRNSKGQAWFLDQVGAVYKKQPLADGVKFQLRTKMSGGRALVEAERQDSNRYALRIQDFAPWDPKQWFVFDSRTRSIRSHKRRSFAIATQINQKMRHYKVAIIQRWGTSKNYMYQKSSFFGGRGKNVRNPGGKCLAVLTNHNSNRRQAYWYVCTSHAGHGWKIDQKGVHFPRYPLRNGIKFQIKSMMKSGRALFYAEHIGSHQYRLRVQNNNPYDNKQWFVFDWRTKSIRPAANRKFVMSILKNSNNWKYYHYAAVVRAYKGEALQKMRWFKGSRRNIRDQGVRCLDVHGNSDTNRRHVHWYKCTNGLNQGWMIDRKGYNYPDYPLANGVKFQIRSRMQGNKALFWKEHIGGHQYRLRIQAHDPENKNQWWVFDSRTRTVRPLLKRTYCLANRKGYKFRINVPVVIRKYAGDNTDKTRWYTGSRRNIRNNGKKCL